MSARKLIWHFLPWYAGIILVSLIAVTWYALSELQRFYTETTERDLVDRAQLLAPVTRPLFLEDRHEDLAALARQLTAGSPTRVTLVLPSGVVAGDTDEKPATMDNHAGRPEIGRALRGEVASSIRYSATLQDRLMYAGVPVLADGKVVGVVRTALPVTHLRQASRAIVRRVCVGGVIVALVAVLVSVGATRRVSQPLRQLTAVTEHFARGDFSRRVPPPDARELATLADSLNGMAAQLDETISTIRQKRLEEEAMLSSMIEGVIAVDSDERIINMNAAASKLLEADFAAVRGRSIQEVVRNVELQRLVGKALTSERPQEADILLHTNGQRHIQAHGSLLRGSDDRVMGALIVLHDVTSLRRLEGIRRDFVANVSHELKTPITTIKGFVETLLDGALQEEENARRFLTIIAKHADRLSSIIEDLLSLSRIEQENDRGGVALAPGRVRQVLASAVEACERKIAAKAIQVDLRCDPEVLARMKPDLLEQAVVNLVDNAVKYSERETTVDLSACREGDRVLIQVRDHGSGVPEETIPRLFERFYRVDKARSRELGGTGLGLAIVKHIVQAHQGRVSVESKLGEGSTFTIELPAA